MTVDQWMQLLPFAVSVISLAVLIGMWRGRQEAADKAAEKAIADSNSSFEMQIAHLEAANEAQSREFGLRVNLVDRDVSALKESIAEVKSRMADSEAERREEFQRLHRIGNETHALIVKHMTDLQRAFVPRTEYDARHEALDRRVARLEDDHGDGK
jgi:hypothetical protein